MRFEHYEQPGSLDACVGLLQKYGPEARLLAGGTDLVPRLKNKLIRPKAVIGLQSVPGLQEIIFTPDGLQLGALVPLRTLSLHPRVLEQYEVIAKAAGHVSSMQVRNMATIGGNACNASPSADAVQGLMLMRAVCQIVGPQGQRQLPLEDFFAGPGKTVLEPGELLTGYFIPTPKEGERAVYKKFAIRGDTDIAIVGAGAALRMDKTDAVGETVITLGAVAPTLVRAKKTEAFLTGRRVTEEVAAEAGAIASGEVQPITDQRATAQYRREMVAVWVKHAILEAYGKGVQ